MQIRKSHGNSHENPEVPWKSHDISLNITNFSRISRPLTPWSSSVATSSPASSLPAASPRRRWRRCSSACGSCRRRGTKLGMGADYGRLDGEMMGKLWENDDLMVVYWDFDGKTKLWCHETWLAFERKITDK